ncbi:metallo-beta-lactamase domain protein [Blattabacterium sp. (Blattella germanica) str. Bge]|uniref:metal-dependent hydrolase n=1 Tax=Blattabacterium sp. (Blattella germanica) TaxID=624186 RepID=UPI0001BB6158|nr:metal-dependent hydrolase [Blattabacterium sp. (Blattella germanica)]ACY40290.1 metallo-beta-lactamase domain protein [Blattabacterium sp. (Blattella germanica) str. Bge]
MKIIFFTHSTFVLKIHDKYLLIDPFFSGNPVFDNKNFLKCIDDLLIRVDYILLTHAHYDHVCDVELFSQKFHGVLVISNYEISNYFEKKGIKTYGMNYGSFISFPFGKLKYVWANHSSVFNDGTYGGNAGGFLLHTNEGNLYISGDTSLMSEMNLIPIFGKLKLSVLPIGGRYTMDIEEAILASDFLKCKKILGVHYNTFEEIRINKDEAKKKFYEKGKELILLEMGESICI